MRVCDRCQSLAVDTVIWESDDQRHDLCATCKNTVMEFISGTAPAAPEGKRSRNDRRADATAGTAQA